MTTPESIQQLVQRFGQGKRVYLISRSFSTRETASTDRQIVQLLYKLYGLTDVEIKIVEGEK